MATFYFKVVSDKNGDFLYGYVFSRQNKIIWWLSSEIADDLIYDGILTSKEHAGELGIYLKDQHIIDESANLHRWRS